VKTVFNKTTGAGATVAPGGRLTGGGRCDVTNSADPGTTPAAKRARDTRSRRAIAAAIARLERSFSARELHAEVCAMGVPVGLTTVYRTLALLLAEGHVREAGRRGGEMWYNACSVAGHHHHLVCERCGTVEETTVCRCEELGRALGEQHGFVLARTPETYFGLCAACAKARRGSRPVEAR
jgi:Fur family ferric uptake transcriptional regulator